MGKEPIDLVLGSSMPKICQPEITPGANPKVRMRHSWVSHVAPKIRPFVGQNVLHLGAGVSCIARVLCRDGSKNWVCLESDAVCLQHLKSEKADGSLPPAVTHLEDGMEHLRQSIFDTIMFIHFFETQRDWGSYLQKASHLLKPGGHLVVLSSLVKPRHSRPQGPYTLNHSTLLRDAPAELRAIQTLYLDCLGILAPRPVQPTRGEIAGPLCDPTPSRGRALLARFMDSLTLHSFGAAILVIWKLEGVARVVAPRQKVAMAEPGP